MRKLLLVLFFISVSTALLAQEVIELDLRESVRRAVENNHTLKRAKLNEKKAEEQVSEAYGNSLFPKLDGNANYRRAIKRQVITIDAPGFSGSFPTGTKNTLTAGVDLEQPLFTGAMFLAVDIAKTYADIQKQSVKYSEAEIISKVKEAYFTYLVAEELVSLSELQLERAEENLRNVESMVGAGLAAEYDKIKANVQVQNLKPALMEAENQRELAKDNLKLLMGMDIERDIIIRDSLEFREYEVPAYKEGLEIVYAKNNLLKQRELNAELQDLNASYEFTQHFPKLNAFGNWQMQAQENDDRAFGDWRYKNSVGVGVRLSVPIFHGFAIESKVQQAEIDHKISIEQLDETRKELTNRYRSAYLTFEKVKKQVQAYDAAVKEAQRGYDISRKQYGAGLGTQLEVTNAMVDYSSAKVNYLRSLSEYYTSYADLENLFGRQANEVKYY